MNARFRMILFVVAAAGLFIGLARALGGLAPFSRFDGAYGLMLNDVAPPERQVQNVVTAVIFDYRGFDTLGEEFILFASVTGVVLLLRDERPDDRRFRAAHTERADDGVAVRAAAPMLAAACWILSGYFALTGHLSMGGGFQAGTIASTAWLVVYLAGGRAALERAAPSGRLEWAETAGAAGYVGVGLLGLAVGAPYLANVLPLGHAGDLLSSGTIFVLDVLVGIEVAAGLALLLVEFSKPVPYPDSP